MPIYQREEISYLDYTFIASEETKSEIEITYNTSCVEIPTCVFENEYFSMLYSNEHIVDIIRPYGTMPGDILYFYDALAGQYVIPENDIFYITHCQ